MLVMREDTFLSNRLSALLEHADLLRHVTEPADDFFVPVIERKDGVGNAGLFAELQDILLSAAQVVPRHARVEMVDSLELQTAVEEVQPGRTVDVHGGAQHLLGKGLVDSQVGRGHGEMRQCDLDMQGGSDNVGDQEECEAATPVGDRFVHHAVAKPVPEKDLTTKFEPDVPPRRALLRGLALQQILPAQAVEVEPCQHHDGVVGVVLNLEHDFGCSVKCHVSIVICAL